MIQYSDSERQVFLQEWKKSGKSIQKYCRENNIRPTTFYGWTKSRKGTLKKESQFIEIKSAAVLTHSRNIILEKNDLKIHIPSDMTMNDLKPLFKILGIIS